MALAVVAGGYGRVKVEYKINLNVFYDNTINQLKNPIYTSVPVQYYAM